MLAGMLGRSAARDGESTSLRYGAAGGRNRIDGPPPQPAAPNARWYVVSLRSVKNGSIAAHEDSWPEGRESSVSSNTKDILESQLREDLCERLCVWFRCWP